MAPHKPIQTYERKTRLLPKKQTKSVDAINALFAENLTKRLKSRRRNKIKLKELPPRTQEYVLEESLRVEPDNTFDKLLKGPNYNSVNVGSFKKVVSSDSECSKIKPTSFFSPVVTRKRRVTSKVKEKKCNNVKIVLTNSDRVKSKSNNHSFFSPIMTRSKRMANEEKSSTLDKPVTSSCLSIEKEKSSNKSLSYIKLPKILESKVFSETFRERQAVHSSTPCTSIPVKKIIGDPLSPITKSDSSNSSNLLEKSYNQIREWDEKFPEDSTPKRRKPSKEGDWKLKSQPKVFLKRFNFVNLQPKVYLTPLYPTNCSFLGFNEKEQLESSSGSDQIKSCLESLEKSIKMYKKSHKLPKKNFITHRRRKIHRSTKKEKCQEKKRSSVTEVEEKRQTRNSHRKFSSSKRVEKQQEKERSTKNSSSKSSHSSKSNITDSTEELHQEKEVTLPKRESLETSYSLLDFEHFVMSYYSREDEPQTDSLEVENREETEKVEVEVKKKDELEESQSSIIDVSSDEESVTPSNSKIVILSNISLGLNHHLMSKEKLFENVLHDHSYSNSPEQKSYLEKQNFALSDIIESSVVGNSSIQKISKKFEQKPIRVKPGKSYRRSLSLLRRSSIVVHTSVKCEEDCDCLKCLFRTKDAGTSRIVPISEETTNNSILETYARRSSCYVQSAEEDYISGLDDSVRSLSLNDPRRRTTGVFDEGLEEITAKDIVLRRCGQTEILPFAQCYPGSALQHCHKIGEGVYGEVFLYRNPEIGGTTVMKIIPVEGDLIVNGERQKKYEEILSEIVIAMELSNLRNNKKSTTTSFAEIQKIRCIQGSYPDRLLDLWELYDETKGSENDSPQIFPPNQVYIILELTNGGKDLESFMFANAQQAFAMFKQTACALAVAEDALKFEHRDLHWGNILLTTVDKKKIVRYRLDGTEMEVETSGVEVTIIDFTLSRIEYDGVIVFNDLSRDDELFVAEGDYQFEIYRLMQKSNGNEWQHFEAYTNVLWLHYLLDKIPILRYKNPRTKIHKEYLGKLETLKDQVLSFNSVVDFVKDKFL